MAVRDQSHCDKSWGSQDDAMRPTRNPRLLPRPLPTWPRRVCIYRSVRVASWAISQPLFREGSVDLGILYTTLYQARLRLYLGAMRARNKIISLP